MGQFWSEFKKFALKGNIMELAIGVIIGGAFGKIVSSVVDDMVMPLFGVLLGGINFSELSFVIGSAVIKYGMFIQNVVNFLIISLVIFSFIKVLSKFSKKASSDEKSPVKSEDVAILEEIRDILKGNTQEEKE